MPNKALNRRSFLKYTALAGVTLAGSGLLAACGDSTATASTPAGSTGTIPVAATGSSSGTIDPRNLANFTNPLNLPGSEGALGVLDLTSSASSSPLELVAKPLSLPLLKGKPAQLLTYQASLGGKSFINPVLRLKKGQTLKANLTNGLSEDTNIHWHGLKVASKMDGHPSRPLKPGENFSYSFPVQNRGGTYWYHPHPHKLTPRQAYSGLASFFVVEDEDTQRLNEALDLKLGETDLPIVIQDKLFDAQGQLVYRADASTQFMGFYGDTILANLTPHASLDVATRIYRLRLLNGSNARTYRLAFVKGTSSEKLAYWLIGTDGGLLDKPYQVTELFLSPGERVELLVDFSKLEAGAVVALKSLSFDPMHNEMGSGMNMSVGSGGMDMGNMGGMHSGHSGMMGSATATPQAGTGNASLDDGQEFYILKLNIKNKVSYNRSFPQALSSLEKPDTTGATVRPVVLSLTMMGQGGQMMQWLINGQSFNMDEYPITVKKNSTEIWEFKNEANSMPHPMHLHGFQFQVLSRQNSPAQLNPLATFSEGRLATDLGWKDTVLVWPGETVRTAINFSHNFEGEQLYVTHCHVLEHEDNGMMVNYKVV
ncbi:MAG TPA: multicopper oxidase domain-containing protein [Chloroflexia bacterium]|nr:multicopper oxidase domain-containing protein [Chloroflexia bacterium]